MKQYHELMTHVIDNGIDTLDRTGVGTRSIFGHQLRFNMSDGFPAITTKKLAWKPIVGELLWFMQGSTNVETLREITWGPGSSKKTIWDDNYNNQAIKLGHTAGNLGPVYGKQWRDFGGIDQLKQAIETIKYDSTSRRNIVSSWNVSELSKMALPPCHTMFQFYVRENKLSCQLYQRSCDLFLGGPFNIASYSLLLHIVARLTNTIPHEFIWTLGDCHIYQNHFDQVEEQLKRTTYDLPTLSIADHIQSLEDVLISSVTDYNLINYKSHGQLTAPMAV
jgi:thymidylate synthase